MLLQRCSLSQNSCGLSVSGSRAVHVVVCLPYEQSGHAVASSVAVRCSKTCTRLRQARRQSHNGTLLATKLWQGPSMQCSSCVCWSCLQHAVASCNVQYIPFAVGGYRRCSHSSRHAVASSKTAPQLILTREQGKNGKLAKALQQIGLATLEVPLVETAIGPDRYQHVIRFC